VEPKSTFLAGIKLDHAPLEVSFSDFLFLLRESACAGKHGEGQEGFAASKFRVQKCGNLPVRVNEFWKIPSCRKVKTLVLK
jgi:hypothetical protein